jgi:hypothetical protein
MKRVPSYLICLIFLLIVNFSDPARATSCYPKEMQSNAPIVSETIIFLIDESAPRDRDAEKGFRTASSSLVNGSRNFVLLTYAGNAAGEALRTVGRWTVESLVTDEKIVNNTVINTYKKSQKCVRDSRVRVQTDIEAAIDKVFSTMPIKTERSEIAFALSSVLKELVQPAQSTMLLHYSDGLQHSKGASGRSFYTGRLPRKLESKTELGWFSKDSATAPRAKQPATYITVLWWGMLAMPTVEKKSKPVYLDVATITSFSDTWNGYLMSLGVDRIQIGAPNLLSADLVLPQVKNPQ